MRSFPPSLVPILMLAAAVLAGGAGPMAEPCCDVMPMMVPAAPGDPPPLLVPISPVAGPPSVAPVVPVRPVRPVQAVHPAPAPLMPAGSAPVAGALPVARGSYTVQKGARLYVVAQRTGTRFADLILLNPKLEIDRMLPAGTKVLLPIAGSW